MTNDHQKQMTKFMFSSLSPDADLKNNIFISPSNESETPAEEETHNQEECHQAHFIELRHYDKS